MRFLLKKGCHFKIRDKDQMTAADLAMATKHTHPNASQEDQVATRALFSFEHETAPDGLGRAIREAAGRGDTYSLHQLATKWRGYNVIDEGDESHNISGTILFVLYFSYLIVFFACTHLTAAS